ncbi:MAG TPA: HNH endonuclease signature motif containing protein [Terracidiphilus sp.]|jgi:hypothetical protein|nr:HNH endonuclease signature motif containing protein [Terracidiphilus sp.]
MPGYQRGRMAETQFKKGQRPHTWLPVGTIVRDRNGYLKMKVRDDPQEIAGVGSSSTNWMYVHRMVWESAHGPVPPGHKVCFRDGNKDNCQLENLVLVSDAQRMRANSIHRLPPELEQVIHLQGALKRRIRRLERGKEPLRGPAEPSVRNTGTAEGQR